VLGGIFLVIVVVLAAVAVKAVRGRQGLALDADGVWWRADRTLVRLPWSDIAAARLVAPPVRVRGARTSAPRTPAVELCPVDVETVRRYPALTHLVVGGATMRFVFRLASAADGAVVGGAIARFAPGQWAAGVPSE
jgi:hypothetical protein